MGTHTNDVHTCTLCVPSGAHIHMTACTSPNFNVHTHTFSLTHRLLYSHKKTHSNLYQMYHTTVPLHVWLMVCSLPLEEERKSKKTSDFYALHWTLSIGLQCVGVGVFPRTRHAYMCGGVYYEVVYCSSSNTFMFTYMHVANGPS